MTKKTGVTVKAEAMREYFDSRRKELESWCAEGLTLEEMGRRLGVNYGTVRNHCLRLGIQHTTKRGWRHGDRVGARHPRWGGGRYISPEGYVIVVAPTNHPGARSSGRILEHRLVMEHKIGRYLDREEVVHHIDGNKQNNHPDNLELYQSNLHHMGENHKTWSWTAEQRANQSAIQAGIKRGPRTPEQRRQQSERQKGRRMSDEQRKKLSIAAKNRPPKTPEQRAAHSERMKRRHAENPGYTRKCVNAMWEARRQHGRQHQDPQEAANPAE